VGFFSDLTRNQIKPPLHFGFWSNWFWLDGCFEFFPKQRNMVKLEDVAFSHTQFLVFGHDRVHF